MSDCCDIPSENDLNLAVTGVGFAGSSVAISAPDTGACVALIGRSTG